MGTRKKRERQQDLWIATNDVVETPANAFYDRLNQLLDAHKFDVKVERLCKKFYTDSPYGRPSIAPGVYFRSLLIGYFEGLDRQWGIAWWCADSLALRSFLGVALTEATPVHASMTIIRQRLPELVFDKMFAVCLAAVGATRADAGQERGH